MDILFSKKNYKKLELLKYLIKHPMQNNLKTISIVLDSSITSTKRLILDLNNDLILYFSKDIYVEINLTSVSLINSADYYSSIDLVEILNMSYLKESIPFQILLLLFNDKDISINKITDTLYISRSFFYKTIDMLINPMKGWHIEFNLASKPNSAKLLAKQEHFRSFYSSFFWITFKQMDWPFESKEQALIRSYISDPNFSFLSPSKLRRIEIYLAITNKMIKEKQFIKLSKDNKRLLQCVSVEHDLSTPIDALFKDQYSSYLLTDIENEKYYFNYIIRLLSPNIDNSSQVQQIGNNFFHCNNPTTIFSKKFLNFIINEFHLDTNQNVFKEMLYYVVFYFFTFIKSNIDFLSFMRVSPPIEKFSIDNLENKELSNSIKSSVDTFFQKNPLTDLSKDANPKDVFYNLVYFIVVSLQKKKLLVYVQCLKNMHSESFLINKLTAVFGNEIFKITYTIDDADIIITDSNDNYNHKNQQIYYFEFTHDLNTWEQLISFLQKKLLKLALM